MSTAFDLILSKNTVFKSAFLQASLERKLKFSLHGASETLRDEYNLFQNYVDWLFRASNEVTVLRTASASRRATSTSDEGSHRIGEE